MKKDIKEGTIEAQEILFCVVNILPPLLIGASVYIWISQDSYFGNWICSIFPITKFTATGAIWKVLRNWGCDYLWAYALFFTLYIPLKNTPNPIRRATLIAAVTAIANESLQLIQIDFLKCGTFDVLDIVVEILAVMIGSIIIYCYKQHRLKEREETVL